MRLGLHAFRRPRWGRILSVLVVGAVLMQGPIQGLVQVAQDGMGTHSCAHAHHEVCPRTPDGSCTCAHTDPADTESEGPVLRACHGGADTLGPVPAPRWRSLNAPTAVPTPLRSEVPRRSYSSPPPPQRYGDDIFRPPRTTAARA